MRIEVSIDGMPELANVLDGIEDALLPLAAQGLARGLSVLEEAAKDHAPYGDGELKGSIIARPVEVVDGGVHGEVAATAPYAGYVEFGTGPVGAESPHPTASPWYYSTGQRTITRMSKNGKPIHWVTDGWVYPTKEGGFRFTRGQPARPYMYKAFQEKRQAVIDAVAAAIKEGLE